MRHVKAEACDAAAAPAIRGVKDYDVRAFLRDHELNLPAFYRHRSQVRKGNIRIRYPNAVKGPPIGGFKRRVDK